MPVEAAEELMKTGRLPASAGETFITKHVDEAAKYNGALMKIEVKAGTTEQLANIGVRNRAANHPFSTMPLVTRPWMHNRPFFKMENDVLNIGLGRGDALDIFNCNIIGCGRVR